jgi:hypothetical protein
MTTLAKLRSSLCLDRDFWALLLLILTCMTAVLVSYLPDDSSAVAAWVQAYGTVLAIFGSIWVARVAATSQQREKLEQAKFTALYLSTTLAQAKTALEGSALHWPDESTFKKADRQGGERGKRDEQAVQQLRHMIKRASFQLGEVPRPTESQLLRLAASAPRRVEESIKQMLLELTNLDSEVGEVVNVYMPELYYSDTRPTIDQARKNWWKAIKCVDETRVMLDEFAKSPVDT